METVWELQEAESKLGEVVENALQNGPQVITKHGAELAVVLSTADYKKLVREQSPVSKFFRNSPLTDAGVELSRDKSPIRLADFE